MLTGPSVVITSANSATGRLLIPSLNAAGYHTIGLIRNPLSIGTDETVTDWMNSPIARGALANADYIIHLSGDANAKNKDAFIASNVETTKRLAENAAHGKCRRIIYLSYAGASTHEKNLYLRCKGEAEELLRNTGRDIVIFRCPVIVDAPGQASRMDALFVSEKGRAVPAIGHGRQRMRPIYRGDVVAAIIAALSRGASGTYELSGPDNFTIDEFIRTVNIDAARVRIRHIPAWLARPLSHIHPQLSPTFVDLMLHHTESQFSLETFREFGIVPTSLRTLFGRHN
jgi:NADH dehydrogenase